LSSENTQGERGSLLLVGDQNNPSTDGVAEKQSNL
jgi:hypothetical protein